MRTRPLERPLRVATACGCAPLILGSVAFFGWLLATGGKSEGGRAFQQLGAIMLTAGPALAAAGLAALWTARRRGANASQLRSRALLIITNLPRAEGALSVVGRQAGRNLSVRDAAMFYVFDRVDVWLVLEPGGAWVVREQPGAPWSWLPGR